MRVVKKYSFNNGQEILEKERPSEFAQAIEALRNLDSEKCKTAGNMYSPKKTAREILDFLYSRGWSKPEIRFEENILEGDAGKNAVGLEIQFGKYAFLSWDSLRKIEIFAKQGAYKYGIEIAPMASLRKKMSQGVGSFEQIAERLEKTGNPELEIPVVVIGIDA